MSRIERGPCLTWPLPLVVMVLVAVPGHAQAPDRLQLEDQPGLVIGEVFGAEAFLFDGIQDVALLPGGGIAVADGQSREIRLFSEDGKSVAVLGGRGEGPGEFQELNWLRVLPDGGLAAFDARVHRLTTFSETGTLAETRTLEWPAEASFVEVEPILDSGAYLVHFIVPEGRLAPPQEGVEVHSQTKEYRWYGPQGIERLGRLPGNVIYTSTIDRRAVLGAPPFGRRAVVASGPGVAVWGRSDRPALQVTRGGGAVRTVEVPLRAVPLTEELWEREKERELDNARPAARDRVRAVFRHVPRPEHVPFFRQVLVDDEDRVWFSEWLEEGGSRTWHRLDADGRIEATLAVPNTVSVLQISGGHVLGVIEGDLGVQKAVKWAFGGGEG